MDNGAVFDEAQGSTPTAGDVRVYDAMLGSGRSPSVPYCVAPLRICQLHRVMDTVVVSICPFEPTEL